VHVAAAHRKVARHEAGEANGAFFVVCGFAPGLNHIFAGICAVVYADSERICFVGHRHGGNGGSVGVFCSRSAGDSHVESHVSVGMNSRESGFVHGAHAVDGICVAAECSCCVERPYVAGAESTAIIEEFKRLSFCSFDYERCPGSRDMHFFGRSSECCEAESQNCNKSSIHGLMFKDNYFVCKISDKNV